MMGAGHPTTSWGDLMGFVNFPFVLDLGVLVGIGPLEYVIIFVSVSEKLFKTKVRPEKVFLTHHNEPTMRMHGAKTISVVLLQKKILKRPLPEERE